jgi:hypothetical protein
MSNCEMEAHKFENSQELFLFDLHQFSSSFIVIKEERWVSRSCWSARRPRTHRLPAIATNHWSARRPRKHRLPAFATNLRQRRSLPEQRHIDWIDWREQAPTRTRPLEAILLRSADDRIGSFRSVRTCRCLLQQKFLSVVGRDRTRTFATRSCCAIAVAHLPRFALAVDAFDK